jgi:hypothetical protein
MAFAHAVIVDPRTDRRFERGSEVPDDLPGIEDLRKFGSVSDEEYDGPVQGEPATTIAGVLTEEDVASLPKDARRALEARGLIQRSVDGNDSGSAGEETS